MQRNEIIKLARESGATIEAGKLYGTIIYEGNGGITFEVLERVVLKAILAEREACAKVCDKIEYDFYLDNKCAEAIRRRDSAKQKHE